MYIVKQPNLAKRLNLTKLRTAPKETILRIKVQSGKVALQIASCLP